jgi:hypothetical protein
MGPSIDVTGAVVGGYPAEDKPKRIDFGSNRVYLDAVFDDRGVVLLNGPPDAVKAWLIENGQESGTREALTVICGESLKTVYIPEYLGR